MPRTHNPDDATFRQEAVELVQPSGQPYRDVARDLGVRGDPLRAWRHQQASQSDARPVSTTGKPSELERENQRLRRELADPQRPREILKKALALCAEQPGRLGDSNGLSRWPGKPPNPSSCPVRRWTFPALGITPTTTSPNARGASKTKRSRH